jgi:DNA-binding MarR family transcriptional regulator
VAHTQLGIPFARGSHASYKAAVSVSLTRKTKTVRYLRHLSIHGPQTDHEAAAALALPLSSVCSIRNNVVDAGLVERGTVERDSPYGRACSTWYLTPAGRLAVSAMTEAA